MKEVHTIYTVGTSTRSLEAFFSILKGYGIRAIADVRRFPKSSRYPHFNRENLQKAAAAQKLAYQWLGDVLGGYRKGGYEAYEGERAYQEGLKRLEGLARNRLTVFICAEKLPWKCHRMHIARSLTERGWDAIHIIEADRTWQAKEEKKAE